jgi:hypothetical protein
VDTKTLVGLFIGVALLVASFFFGRATVHIPTVNTDTVRIHHYTTVEPSFRIDTVPAYLRLVKGIEGLKSDAIKLRRYSDSLQKFIDEPDQLIAALDTTLVDSSRLNIQYLFPPINSFLLDYRARPYYSTKDTIFIQRKVVEEVYKEHLFWLQGSLGYMNKNPNIGAYVGIKDFGIGCQLFMDKSPNYLAVFKREF